MEICQVPTSPAIGVQLRVLPVCQAGTAGIQVLVPTSWRTIEYWIVPGVPPVTVGVQVMGLP